MGVLSNKTISASVEQREMWPKIRTSLSTLMALTVPFMTFSPTVPPSDTTANLGRFVGISRRKERVKAKEKPAHLGRGVHSRNKRARRTGYQQLRALSFIANESRTVSRSEGTRSHMSFVCTCLLPSRKKVGQS